MFSNLPDELIQKIYSYVFDNCLVQLVKQHKEREKIKQDYQRFNYSNECVCHTGKWCEDCYGEYDLFD